MKKTFTIERVANMVFITSQSDIIWNSWMVDEVTERKLNNAIKKIKKCFDEKYYEIEIINKL